MRPGTFIVLLAAALLASCFPPKPSFERDTTEEADMPGGDIDISAEDAPVEEDTAEDGDADSPDDITADENPIAPWTCRRAITIDNTADPDTLVDFQVSVAVPHEDPMRADFGDLRFRSADMTTTLPCWAESRQEGLEAVFWIKLPLIRGSSSETVFMLFGNPAAADEGNPSAVFDFYEGFELGSLDRWGTINDPAFWLIDEAKARTGTSSLTTLGVFETNRILYARSLALTDIALDSWWWFSDTTGMDTAQIVRFNGAEPLNGYDTNFESPYWAVGMYQDGAWSDILETGLTATAGVWMKVSTVIVGGSLRVLVDDTTGVSDSGWVDVGTGLPGGTVAIRGWNVPDGVSWWVDDVAVRKAADPFPSTRMEDRECF
jgi:hypothetical protein